MDVLFILQNTRWNINSSDEYDFLTQRDLTGNSLQCIFSKYMYEIFSSFFDLIFHVRQILKSVAVLTFRPREKLLQIGSGTPETFQSGKENIGFQLFPLNVLQIHNGGDTDFLRGVILDRDNILSLSTTEEN